MNDTAGFNQGLTQTMTVECSKKLKPERIEAALTAIDGVRSVDVEDKTVTVNYDPTIVDQNALRAAVEDGGGAPVAGGQTLGGADDRLFSSSAASGERSDNRS
jgi:hypothetical protein